MNKPIWQRAVVSPCETYHLFEGKALYTKRFIQVLKFHEPGLASAKNIEGAFHIDEKGNPAYRARYIDTFGFYEGLAAVDNEEGWFHVTPSGKACYKDRFSWCGNFQEGLCAIKDKSDRYYHINRQGQKVYESYYSYVGDFKNGIAVVCNDRGLHTHIDGQGQFIHDQWFMDLDVFHKGYARAKDEKGWFHVNKQGIPIYHERHAQVEPFYNGVARIERWDKTIDTVDVNGKSILKIFQSSNTSWQSLSEDMVGFWKTEIIAGAVKLGLFNCLPGTSLEIARKGGYSIKHIERLLRALWELELVQLNVNVWNLRRNGNLLSPQEQSFLAAAAIMWSDVNSTDWKSLPDIIRFGKDARRSVFKSNSEDQKLKIYHQAIDGYSQEDFSKLTMPCYWKDHTQIIGFGRSAKTLLEKLLFENANQKGILLGEEYVLNHLNVNLSLASRFRTQCHNILLTWPLSGNAILLPKVLHYWGDQEVIKILKNAHDSLLSNGKIYIFEFILENENPIGSLLDLNMLIESGGKLRFLSDWRKIFSSCGLKLIENNSVNPCLNMLILEKGV